MGAYWDLLALGLPPPPGRPPGSLLFGLPSNPQLSVVVLLVFHLDWGGALQAGVVPVWFSSPPPTAL